MLPVIVAIQNGPSAPINLLGKWLTEAGFEIRTIHAYAKQPLPQNVNELRNYVGDQALAALIPLGGSMGALDDADAPWLATERSLISDAVAKEIPVLGICLGAQLLAVSLDGSIDKGESPEIGLTEIEVNNVDDSIFGELASQRLPTIQWHQDVVSRLPSDAISLASSSYCRNQIYRVGHSPYGIQFHPEADPTIVRMWEKKADEAYRRSQMRTEIADEVRARMSEMEALWKAPIMRWAAMVFDRLETQPRQQGQLQ